MRTSLVPIISLSSALLLINCSLWGQGPISGFLSGKGKLDIALGYSIDRFDRYLGQDGEESFDLETSSYNIFLEYGLDSNMALVVTAPWMQINDREQGWQDANVWLKYRNQKRTGLTASNSFFTAVGVSFPIGNYTTGERTSLGRRATIFQGRLVWQLDHFDGWFLHAQSGIDFQLAPIATAVWPVVLRTGFGSPYFYVEAWFESVKSLNEAFDNTLTVGAGSSWNRIGGTLYFPIQSWIGIFGGTALILDGTNIGKSTRWNLGTVIKFGKD